MTNKFIFVVIICTDCSFDEKFMYCLWVKFNILNWVWDGEYKEKYIYYSLWSLVSYFFFHNIIIFILS